MRYSKSMYRGGFIVDAESCDYESSRKLGLVCPFCSQAVFLRSGSLYQRKDKQVIVRPSFAHYHSDDPLAKECELRSERKEGQEYIKTLEVASRNQRLELYNKRLWEVFKEKYKITKENLNSVSKEFGRDWIEKTARLGRLDLGKNLEFYLEEARKAWQYQLSLDPEKANQDARKIWTEEEIFNELQELKSFDRDLQMVIFQEVIEFLSTRTGGYAYQKIFRFSLEICCSQCWMLNFMQKPPVKKIAIEGFAEHTKRTGNVTSFNKTLVIMLTGVNWVKLFNQLED